MYKIPNTTPFPHPARVKPHVHHTKNIAVNLSFDNIRFEMKPVYTEGLFSEREPLEFTDKFKVIHLNMCLSTERAKATISKSGLI